MFVRTSAISSIGQQRNLMYGYLGGTGCKHWGRLGQIVPIDFYFMPTLEEFHRPCQLHFISREALAGVLCPSRQAEL